MDSTIEGDKFKGKNRFAICKGWKLSAREQEVLILAGELNTNVEIAFKLGINIKTVEKHRMAIHYKLGFHCLGELIHYVLAKGLVKNKYSS